MMDVEELERALLAGARKSLAPSASDRMRIQSRLVGNPAWFQSAPPPRSALRAVFRSWRGGLTLGFAVGALLGFGASRGLEAALGARAPSAVVASPGVLTEPATALRGSAVLQPGVLQPGVLQPGVLQAAVPEPAAPLAAAPIEPSSLDGAAESAPERPLLRGRHEGASARSAAQHANAEDSGSTLAQELALLQRARRALNRNDALLALGIVQSLDERFPDGVLMEERVATRILSLCQLERRDEAREQGQHFLSLHPRSVYAERVRHSCAGEK